MPFIMDEAFYSYFNGRLKQVFFYITDKCNLMCKQCIYKPSVIYNRDMEIPFKTVLGLASTFYNLGARKINMLGGEPTLYGGHFSANRLSMLIDRCKHFGYEYVRIDTNGQFDGLIENKVFDMLDELAFSIDGYNSILNDKYRGKGTFKQAVKNIEAAVQRNVKVTITTCLHKDMVKRRDDGQLGVHKMILFAEKIGAQTINFHDLFKVGVPMDTWTGSFDTSIEEHLQMYHEIKNNIQNDVYNISVRLPRCFVTEQEFQTMPSYYGYCPVKQGERVMVHPDGTIRICSNLICTGYGVAHYQNKKIIWDQGVSNETLRHEIDKCTPCTNRSKNKSYGKYVPLCFSFKPNQDEYVWKQLLDWDSLSNENRSYLDQPVAFAAEIDANLKIGR